MSPGTGLLGMLRRVAGVARTPVVLVARGASHGIGSSPLCAFRCGVTGYDEHALADVAELRRAELEWEHRELFDVTVHGFALRSGS